MLSQKMPLFSKIERTSQKSAAKNSSPEFFPCHNNLARTIPLAKTFFE